jgi:hypothetical protein
MTPVQLRTLISIADEPSKTVPLQAAKALEEDGYVERIPDHHTAPLFRLTTAGVRELPHARVSEAISRVPSTTLQGHLHTLLAKHESPARAEAAISALRASVREAYHRGETFTVPSARGRATIVRTTAMDLSALDLVLDVVHARALSEAS